MGRFFSSISLHVGPFTYVGGRRVRDRYIHLICALIAFFGVSGIFVTRSVPRLHAPGGHSVDVAYIATSLAAAKSAALANESGQSALFTAPSTYNWLQFGGTSQHTSENNQESIISSSNVATLSILFRVRLPRIADSSPVYLTAVSTPIGVRDVVYVTTKDGRIIAIDAHDGSKIWHRQHGPGTCLTPQNYPCYTAASPAIDPNLQFGYSYGLDGYVHKYQVGDGIELSGAGWPELVTMKPEVEKVSSSLATATTSTGTTYLYVLTSSFGDAADYQGHLTAINLTDPAHTQKVFNAMCSNQSVHFVLAPGKPDCSLTHSGEWGRAGPLYDPQSNRIFVATGNGVWDPATSMWGDSVLALLPDGRGTLSGPVDSYTPVNQQDLNGHDKDLGGANPVALPVPRSSLFQDVVVQAGKDGILRLINLTNPSGQGGPGHLGG